MPSKAQRPLHPKSSSGGPPKKSNDGFDKAAVFQDTPKGKVHNKGDPAPKKDKPAVSASVRADEGTFPFHNDPSDGGADGSHDKSQDSLGGARAHFKDSGPKEQKSYYGGRRKTT